MTCSLPEALVSVAPRKLRTHCLIIAATGAGKTNLIHHLIAQDVMLCHSFMVLDMRGDLVNAALGICAGRVPPEKIALLDLREKKHVIGFNPLQGAGEPFFRALNVHDVVAAESESWGVQLSETLRQALMLLATAGRYLTDLESLFFDDEFRNHCLSCSTDESVNAFWGRYAALSAEKKQVQASPVLNKVSLLMATPALRAMLSHEVPVDLGTHLNTPGTVTLVSLAADELHGAGRMMGSLILAAVCREIFARVTIAEADRIPVRLYVDEFEHFGTREFETILAEGRKFGISLVLAHQTLAQLAPRARSVILNGVGVKIAMRTGRDDSSVLSQDLTGNSKEIDLSQFPVGEAIIWTSEDAPIHIEVNAPIVRNPGVRTKSAEDLVRQIRLISPPATARPRPRLRKTEHEPVPAVPEKLARSQPAKKDLGSWL